jgi:hypothetical protein
VAIVNSGDIHTNTIDINKTLNISISSGGSAILESFYGTPQATSKVIYGIVSLGPYQVSFPYRLSVLSGTVTTSATTSATKQISALSILSNPPQNRHVLWGDSNFLNALGPLQPSVFVYDPVFGLATVTANNHGWYSGTKIQIGVTNVASLCFYDLVITRIDANNFTVNLPTGLSNFPSVASIWCASNQYLTGDYPNAWLKCSRPRIVRVVATVSDTAQTIVSKFADVLAKNPSSCEFRLGTNNRLIDTPQTVYALALQGCQMLSDANIPTILHTIPPVGTADSPTGAWIIAYNKLLRQIPKQINGIYICDDWRILIDPASIYGAALSGTLRTDNLHLTAKGGYLIATTPIYGLQACFDKIYQTVTDHPCSLIEAYNATYNPNGDDAFGNGMLYTTTGGSTGAGSTGAVASGLQTTIIGMGGTVLSSVVSAAIGNAQRLVGTPASVNDQFLIKTADMSSRVIPGEYRKAKCHIKTSGIAANANTLSLAMIVQLVVGGVTYNQIRSLYSYQSVANSYPQVDVDMDLESEPFLIPNAGVTSLTFQIQLFFAGAGSAVTMDVSQWGMQRVLYNA